jgi:orotate phosphoribosyltransferase
MEELDIDRMVNNCEALITNTHIVYSSGKHGDTYFNKNRIFTKPDYISWIGKQFAQEFANEEIDAVIGPVTGGAILSSWTAYYLSELDKKNIYSLYADKKGDSFVIKRGYDQYCRNKNVLVVEDVLTTGGSVKKVIEAVIENGGKVVGVASICNRGSLKKSNLETKKLFSLKVIDLKSYPAENCPLCKKGIPINKELGHGQIFVKSGI